MVKEDLILFNENGYDYEKIEKDYRECYDIEESEEINEERIYNYLNDIIDADYTYAKEVIQEMLDNLPCKGFSLLIEVDIGAWNGRSYGATISYSEYFEAALDKMIDDADIKIGFSYEGNGKITVAKSHHDSTNYYNIYVIPDRYTEYFQSIIDNQEKLDKKDLLKKTIKLSRTLDKTYLGIKYSKKS